MKKIMIVAALMLATCGLNAASYNWSCGSDWAVADTASEGGDYQGYMVYLFDGNTTSLSTLTSAFAGGDLSGLDQSLGSTSIDEDYFSMTGSGLSAVDNSLSAFAVIFDTAAAGGHFTAVTFDDVALTDAIKGGGAADFYQAELYLGASTSWTAIATSAAPEPTSGLLLLLGMAGLALRRKQA